jgi:uncharacterized protein (TIGR02271 family)
MSILDQNDFKDIAVIRDDGATGVVVGKEQSGLLVIEFSDSSRVVVAEEVLIAQPNGVYRLEIGQIGQSDEEEVVIPVIAEEIQIETQEVVRGKVRVLKRVETREEIFDAPVIHEEVVVERLPINRFVDDIVPEIREEEGVLIIPLIEEVLVVEKRFLLTEEVRVSKQRRTENNPQKVILRREVVDIERLGVDDQETPNPL